MRTVCLFLLWFFIHTAVAQEVLNNNAPSLQWQRIQTPNFKILYPTGFDQQAQRMANTLEHIRNAESKSLGGNTKKISVILQNQTSVSNGFVSLIPRRSEFYTMPPQDYNFTGTTEWLDQLASHEYRHVVQFDKANRGFNRLLYYAFGPATMAAMAVTAVPQWFWEGDAVVTETAFTHGGRGRIPNFGLVFRTNLLEDRTFNYHKQYLRSFKHNIPDHYVLGYHMVSYLRERTNNPMIWEKITRRSWSVPFIPFRFSSAIKKETGLFVTDLYTEMASDLRKSWQQQLTETQLTSFETIHTRDTKAYTDYAHPQVLGDGSVIVMKWGIGDFSQFRLLNDGREKRSFIPGLVNESGMLSATGNHVIWNEFTFHPRWRAENYSVIKMYNVSSKKLKIVTAKTRYAGAALSPDESKIVTVETNTSYETSLLVIDTLGNVLKKFPNPDHAFYSMARWSDNGNSIVALKSTKEGRTIVLINYATGAEVEIFPYSQENMGHPVAYGRYIFYNSPLSGIDNIYGYDQDRKQKFQVTSSKYGAFNPSVANDGKELYYNEQTRDGLDVVKIPFDPSLWTSFIGANNFQTLDQVITEQEGRPNLFDSIPSKTYASKRYHKLSGIFNPYSWGAYFDSGLTQADIGISSQDVLSTTILKFGYLYDINERAGSWRAGISYQNWFPIIDLDFKVGNRSDDLDSLTYRKVVSGDTTQVTEKLDFQWAEKNIEMGMRIPLLTTKSRFHSNVSFANYFGITQVSDFTNSIDGGGRIIPANFPQNFFRSYQDNGTLVYNKFNVSAYRLLKRSRRDINSKWGQTLDLTLYNTSVIGDFSGKQMSFYTTLYFPGLFKHHSLWGYWAYQSTDIPVARANGEGLDNYIFRNQIPLPRGIGISRFQKFYSMSMNYTMPVWYPDIALGPILNIQRIRMNAFTDYGYGRSVFGNNPVIQQSYLSLGAEVKVDVNIMRFLEQFNVGFRYSYGVKPFTVTQFEFLIGAINF